MYMLFKTNTKNTLDALDTDQYKTDVEHVAAGKLFDSN